MCVNVTDRSYVNVNMADRSSVRYDMEDRCSIYQIHRIAACLARVYLILIDMNCIG